jgi:sialic acid synthase
MTSYKKPIVIAEIGCNHKGNMDTAKALIRLAKECKASVAKFQKRNPKELLSAVEYVTPHPNPENSYGDTYGAHREFLEFDLDQHRELKKYCENKHIQYSASVWDVTSANEIASLNPTFIKVPSARNTDFEMLKVLRDAYEGEVHVSFGMTKQNEEERIISFFEETGAGKRLVVYSCTSGYPVAFDDVCLLEINRLSKSYRKRVKEIAFSGHHLGIAVDMAAYALGARWIERHFTKDRTWKGTDHAASLEPAGLHKLVRDLNAVYKAMKPKGKEILDVEHVQRKKLKFSESK